MKRWIFPLLAVTACGGKLLPEADGGAAATPSELAPEAGAAKPTRGAFCASQSPRPRFCEDFDAKDALDHWDIATRLNGDLVATATLDAETVPLRDGETANVHLRKTVSGRPTKSLRFAASLRWTGAALARGAVAIVTLDLSPTHLFTLYLRDDGAGPSLQEIGSLGTLTRRHALRAIPPRVEWTRLAIELDVAVSRVRVAYDDETVLDEDTFTMEAVDPTLRIGAVYVIGPADAFDVHFDDVVLDF